MKIIAKPARTGKTHELIKLSAETGDYIVCKSLHEANGIQCIAMDLGLKIPLPITYREFIAGDYSPNIKGLLIDNVDRIVQYMARPTATINAITLSD